MEVKRDFLNLNFVAQKLLHVFNRVEPFNAVESELSLEIFERGVFFDEFAVVIGVGAANENVNQIVKHARGD